MKHLASNELAIKLNQNDILTICGKHVTIMDVSFEFYDCYKCYSTLIWLQTMKFDKQRQECIDRYKEE